MDLIISATMVTQLLTEELIEGFKIRIFRALTAKATCPQLVEGWIRVFSRNFQQPLFIQFLLLCARWATSAAVSTVICESKFLKAAAANSQGSRSMISLNSGCTGTLLQVYIYLHLQVPNTIFKGLADPWLAWICSRPKDPRLAWNLCTQSSGLSSSLCLCRHGPGAFGVWRSFGPEPG